MIRFEDMRVQSTSPYGAAFIWVQGPSFVIVYPLVFVPAEDPQASCRLTIVQSRVLF
jgi:hypothetical protein